MTLQSLLPLLGAPSSLPERRTQRSEGELQREAQALGEGLFGCGSVRVGRSSPEGARLEGEGPSSSPSPMSWPLPSPLPPSVAAPGPASASPAPPAGAPSGSAPEAFPALPLGVPRCPRAR